jgi:hypothetical protein
MQDCEGMTAADNSSPLGLNIWVGSTCKLAPGGTPQWEAGEVPETYPFAL